MLLNALRTPDDRRWYRLSLGALIAAAWASLALWGASPYAGLLDHGGGTTDLGPLARTVLFVVGWTFQFVGHYFEGRKPSFVEDRRNLIVGLLWWLKKSGVDIQFTEPASSGRKVANDQPRHMVS